MTYLTTDEVAALTKKSPHEIRRLAKAGKIPAFRQSDGARWRFDPDEIDAWIRGTKPRRQGPITTGRRRTR